MADKGAKIRFIAETGEFNDAIKKSNAEIKELKAELKLNAKEMSRNGETVDALEKKHSMLENQISLSETKTEALNQKIQKAIECFGENSTEVINLKTKLAEAKAEQEGFRVSLDYCNTKLEEQRRIEKELNSETNKLTTTIEEQKAKLDKLKEEYVEVVLQTDKNSKEAKNLAREIKNLSSDLEENQSKMREASQNAEKLDKSLDGASKSSSAADGGFTILKGTIADLASNAIQWAVSKLGDFIGYLGELPEATRELRQDLSTLETSFDNVGMSTDTAKETWKDLYAVFGEDDRAVETANHIAKIADNQQELERWVTITTGIWGTYQDSLPVEGLAEAANETAKTGAVTGVLADALNWSSDAAVMFADYMGEDVVTAEDAFNEALLECSNEQERQQLITDTLTALYGDAAETYRDTADAQMEAKDATAEYMLAEAEMAETIEPVTTKFTELKTELLEGAMPAIETVCGGIETGLDWILNSEETIEDVKESVHDAWQEMEEDADELWTGVTDCFSKIKEGAVRRFGETKNNAVQSFNEMKNNAGNRAREMKESVVNKYNEMKSGTSIVLGAMNTTVSQKLSNMKTAYESHGGGIKGIAFASMEGVKGFYTAGYTFIDNLTGGKLSSISAKFQTKMSEAQNTVSSKISGIQTSFSTGLSGAFETVSSKFEEIREKISSKIENARQTVQNAVDKIKGVFSGWSWSLPNIKTPHFSVSGGEPPWGFLGKGSLPKVSVSWYAKGALFTGPTIIPANGFGEADPEYALPLNERSLTPLADMLGDMILDKIGSITMQTNVIDYDKLANALSKQPISVKCKEREIGRLIREVM